MPDINPSLPVVGQPDSTEEPKIVTALTQLIAAVNDVDSDQIKDGTVTLADLVAGSAGLAQGSFSAYRSTALSLANLSVVVFDAEEWDTSSWYDTTTGKFTPQVAGIYAFSWAVAANQVQTSDVMWKSSLRKNGDNVKRKVGEIGFQRPSSSGTPVSSVGAAQVELNGSTDYVEIVVEHSTGSAQQIAASAESTYFQARLVGRT